MGGFTTRPSLRGRRKRHCWGRCHGRHRRCQPHSSGPLRQYSVKGHDAKENVMNKAKTYACWFAALAGLFVIGSLIQSRESQAKGAYSTPVTVMNTTANPGSVLDASRASRVPYQSMVQMNCGNGVFTCEFPFTTAPSGF